MYMCVNLDIGTCTYFRFVGMYQTEKHAVSPHVELKKKGGEQLRYSYIMIHLRLVIRSTAIRRLADYGKIVAE